MSGKRILTCIFEILINILDHQFALNCEKRTTITWKDEYAGSLTKRLM